MGGMAPAASKGSPPPGNGQGLAMDPNGTPFSRTLDGGVCTDCTVLAAAIDIVFANGSRADIANGVYLHHLVAQTMGNSTGKGKGSWVDACPRAGITTSAGGVQAPSALAGLLGGVDLGSVASGGAFVGGAVDAFVDWFTAPDGSVRSGYFIPAGSWGFMSGEVINYLREEQTVYVQLDIEWVKGKYGRDAIKSPLNVEGCDFTHSAFKNGGDRGKITSADFTVSRDVTVICQRAHMHDGGEAVTAFVNGKPICTSQATYGSAGAELIVNGKAWKTISKMSDCLDPVELKKGDKIRLEATYDNVAHPLRESGHEQQGNMAFMTFTVVPKDGI
ncbi:hypothetical protein EJ06DRAFT_288207 [Trichodelitschia bisporula]|uniref:Uncharacterized protein n=1 Tax=Trichodelitschia bisporula TaxID=703511 RepID=A0A6G1I603_9PEZI|nr:hypothetical protein EJ06DRAFT_288207 [Trichodelitschia bisporula]